MAPAPDTHRWFTISRHPSREGVVTYRRCPCGRWQTLVDGAEASGPLGPCRRLVAVRDETRLPAVL